MAAKDTISGQIRVSKLTSLGDLITVAGNFGSAEVDHKADPENAVYINPNPKYNLPVGARSDGAPHASFSPGATIAAKSGSRLRMVPPRSPSRLGGIRKSTVTFGGPSIFHRWRVGFPASFLSIPTSAWRRRCANCW